MHARPFFQITKIIKTLAGLSLGLLVVVGQICQATGFQVGFGGLTPHYDVGPGFHNYCHQIGHSNAILNPIYYLRVEGQRDAVTAFLGEDSICSHIEGGFYTLKAYEGKWFGFGFTFGGYHFYMNHWITEENNTPPNKVPVYPVYSKIGNFYFVPLVAPEFNFGLLHAGTWGLFVNAIVTPIISNVSVSLKKTF